jgi:nucleoside-diphosphate-sugar epimerase
VKRILLTGANGFVGLALCKRLLSEGHHITAALRRPAGPFFHESINSVIVGNVDDKTDWTQAVEGIDVVVHLAARVHQMVEGAADPIQAYRQVNVEGTRNLAESAAHAGVGRFVYLSSVKVNGEERLSAYREDDDPAPQDPYGISKREGERQVGVIAEKSAMECVVIRPPLVYGPAVKANFLTLMGLVDRKVPLPLANIRNRRSFIYLGNLVDCIFTCMAHPSAAGQTFLVSDDKDISTPELIRLIASSLKTTAYLFPCPQTLLRSVAGLLGKKSASDRLLGSLTVDIAKIKRKLSWMPPFSIESGLLDTAKWFKERKKV